MPKPKQPRSISKKIRFEVFKRDSFTCQYCGHKAPDVVLQVDHVEPVSKGGTSQIFNLVTSCYDCNSGKSDRQLSDKSVVDVQHRQLVQLQEKREQVEMMFKWQKGLIDIDETIVNQLVEHWNVYIPGRCLNAEGVKIIKSLHRKFEIGEIIQAMKISSESYLRFDAEGNATVESVSNALHKIGGICYLNKIGNANSRLYYIRGILRKRLNYLDFAESMLYLKKAVSVGIDDDTLTLIAKATRNWTSWKEEMEEAIKGAAGNVG